MRKNIKVRCLMNEIGEVIPLEIEWDTGAKYVIDKVLDKRKVASTKGGGMGIRYICRILGKERYLFLDGYIWFVEVE